MLFPASTPPEVHSDGDATVIVLRGRGCMRIPIALFLAVWLCGWAAGEIFAGRALFFMLTTGTSPDPPQAAAPTLLFLGVWFTFWTAAGLVAAGSLLRLLAGRDEIHVAPQEWRVRRGIAGFGRMTVFPTSAIREVLIDRRGLVIAELEDRDVALTSYGNTAENQWIIDRSPSRRIDKNHELPPRWRAVREGDQLKIEQRRFEGFGCLLLCAFFAAAAVAMILTVDSLPLPFFIGASIVATLFALLFVWGALSRRGWLVKQGRVSAWLTFPGFRREKQFDRDSLRVTYYRDSDSDEQFKLIALVDGRKHTLLRDVNDERVLLRLGRFLAKEAGWTLRTDDFPDRAAIVARMRAAGRHVE